MWNANFGTWCWFWADFFNSRGLSKIVTCCYFLVQHLKFPIKCVSTWPFGSILAAFLAWLLWVCLLHIPGELAVSFDEDSRQGTKPQCILSRCGSEWISWGNALGQFLRIVAFFLVFCIQGKIGSLRRRGNFLGFQGLKFVSWNPSTEFPLQDPWTILPLN